MKKTKTPSKSFGNGSELLITTSRHQRSVRNLTRPQSSVLRKERSARGDGKTLRGPEKVSVVIGFNVKKM